MCSAISLRILSISIISSPPLTLVIGCDAGLVACATGLLADTLAIAAGSAFLAVCETGAAEATPPFLF
ncbi:hypothetical protein D3C86_2130720 [compost metagenome]